MGTKRFNINFEDLPLQATAPEFLNYPSDPSGSIDSEVGEPCPIIVPFNGIKRISAYRLRKPRSGKGAKIPFHNFGKAHLGDAFAAMTLKSYPIPAVGTTVEIHPQITPGQRHICNMYRNIRADAVFILQVPVALGMSGKFHVFAPESDATTKTRGVFWTYSSSSWLAVHLPFSSDLPIVQKDVRRRGMSGLTLKLTLEVDNTTESPVQPLTLNVWSMVTNVSMTEYIHVVTPSDVFDGLKFTPVGSVPPTMLENYYWGGETQADTGVDPASAADISDQQAVRKDEPTTAVKPADVEQVIPKPKPKELTTRAKKQTQSIGQKWVVIHTAKISSGDVGTVKTVTINPKVRQKSGFKGEELTRPYMRNRFVSGDNSKNYTTIVEITMRTTKSSYMAGIIKLTDSKTGKGNQVYAEVGGADVIFQVMADQHADTAGLQDKYRTQTWLSTKVVTYTFQYTLVSFNRTADVSDVDVTFSVRLGAAQFHVPTKAAKPVAPASFNVQEIARVLYNREEENTANQYFAMQALGAALQGKPEGFKYATVQMVYHEPTDEERAQREKFYQADEDRERDDIYELPRGTSARERELKASELTKEQRFTEAGGDVLESTNIAPVAGENPSDFIALTDQGTDDNIEQNENWLCVYKGSLIGEEPIVIPIDIPAIIDKYQDDGDNPIVETFRRFAHVIPTAEGQLGPVIGNYVIQIRLPTTHTANIAHICLPGDMNESSAELYFGLGSILSLATSVISSVGGPLLSTAFNTANAATGGIMKPLLGAAGSLIPPVLGAVGKLINPRKQTPADVMAPVIGGDLPIGRFLNLLKAVNVNEAAEPSLPNLALQVIDKFFPSGAYADEPIPFSVYIKLADVGMEREVFDREIVYEPTPPALRLTFDEVGRLVDKAITANKMEIAKNLVMTAALSYKGNIYETLDVMNLTDEPYDPQVIGDFYSALSSNTRT